MKMGQYHQVVNLDKHEKLYPHVLGDGLKLMEFGCSSDGTMTALAILLAGSCKGGPRGGGDFPHEHPMSSVLAGRWAGDRIAIIGDYAEDGDVPGMTRAELESAVEDSVDISCFMRQVMADAGFIELRAPWGRTGDLSRVDYDKDRNIFVDTSNLNEQT